MNIVDAAVLIDVIAASCIGFCVAMLALDMFQASKRELIVLDLRFDTGRQRPFDYKLAA